MTTHYPAFLQPVDGGPSSHLNTLRNEQSNNLPCLPPVSTTGVGRKTLPTPPRLTTPPTHPHHQPLPYHEATILEVLPLSQILYKSWICSLGTNPTRTLWAETMRTLFDAFQLGSANRTIAQALAWAASFAFSDHMLTRDALLLNGWNGDFDNFITARQSTLQANMFCRERLNPIADILRQCLPPLLFDRLYRLADGLPLFVPSTFEDNNAPEPPAKVYRETAPAVHKILSAQWELGTVLLIPTATLLSGKYGTFHFSPIRWTEAAKDCGRILADFTNSIAGHNINGNTPEDVAEILAWARETFGELTLPNLHGIIAMLFQAAETHGWENMVLVKADVKAAFNQIFFKPESVRRTAFALLAGMSMLNLVGNFGWRCTPFAWNILSQTILYWLNFLGIMFVCMYVDDVMLACHYAEVNAIHATIESIFELLMGPGALAPAKKEVGRKLVLIGWLICLDTLTVQPSRPILLKTIHSLFDINLSEPIHLKTLQTIASRCERFLEVAPIMSPFLQALYNDIAGYKGNMQVRHRLSNLARQDILLWRSFMLMWSSHPEELAAPFSQFRPRPWTVIFGHDGCLTGLGVWIAERCPTTGTTNVLAFIRISPLPFEFTDDATYQNTHEFMCVVVGLFLARGLGLHGFEFSVVGDSITTLSWVHRGRAKSTVARRCQVAYAAILIATAAQPGYMSFLKSEDNIICDPWSRGIETTMTRMIPRALEVFATPESPLHALLTLCNPQAPLDTLADHSCLYSNLTAVLDRIKPHSIPRPTIFYPAPALTPTTTIFTPRDWC